MIMAFSLSPNKRQKNKNRTIVAFTHIDFTHCVPKTSTSVVFIVRCFIIKLFSYLPKPILPLFYASHPSSKSGYYITSETVDISDNIFV